MSRKLFHAIVVVGAAIAPGADCGGKAVIDGGSGGGGKGGGGASSSSAKSGATTSGDLAITAGGGVTSPEQCAKTADFHCDSYMPYTNCACIPGSPEKPSDCKNGEQFVCHGGTKPPIGCDCIVAIGPK